MFANSISKTTRIAQLSARHLPRQMYSQSSAPAASSSKVPKSSSKAHQQTYLTSDRKRDLISIYQQTEQFVTHENLSKYIDFKFTMAIKSDRSSLEAQRAELENVLADRQAGEKMTTRMDDALETGSNIKEVKPSLRQMRIRRARRIKAAFYGADESLQPGLEAVGERKADIKAYGSSR